MPHPPGDRHAMPLRTLIAVFPARQPWLRAGAATASRRPFHRGGRTWGAGEGGGRCRRAVADAARGSGEYAVPGDDPAAAYDEVARGQVHHDLRDALAVHRLGATVVSAMSRSRRSAATAASSASGRPGRQKT